MEEKPNYYAIIPANVRYDTELKANAKLMYGEITALSSKFGECTASNNYFARLYEVDSSAISKWITQLKDKQYIEVKYETKGKEIVKRIIRIIGSDKYQYVLPNEQEGYCQMNKENNTSINNTSIKEIYKEKFKKPTLEEVEEYCKERNNGINAQRFIDYYETNGWKQGKGKPIKDWRACVRTWERNDTSPGWFTKTNDVSKPSEKDIKEMEEMLNEI